MSTGLRLGADSVRPNPGYLAQLLEFGYPELESEKALMAVKNESLDAAITWLEENRASFGVQEVATVVSTTESLMRAFEAEKLQVKQGGAAQVSATPLLSTDIRLDGASRSKMEQDREEHRLYKMELERKEKAAARRRAKDNAAAVKEAVRKQLEEKRRRKNNAAALQAEQPPSTSAPKKKKKAISEEEMRSMPVTLQVRVPNKRPLKVTSLTAANTLADLYAAVDAEVADQDYVLTVPFPPPATHLSRDEDAATSIYELGLAPRASLMVTPLASLGKAVEGHGALAPPPAAVPMRPGLFRGPPVAAEPVHPPPQQQQQQQPPREAVKSRFLKEEGDESLCEICQGPFEDGEVISTLQCLHFFHSDCWDEWKEESGAVCPKCQ